MAINKPTGPVIPESRNVSTYRNSSVRTYADVANRIKIRLGAPYAPVNVTDEAIANHIDEAIEMYSRYAGYDKEYVIFCDDALTDGCWIQLDEVLINSTCAASLSSSSVSGDVTEITYISGETVERELLGSTTSLLSAFTNASGDDIQLTYDPDNPWTFEVCDANSVDISPLSSYPDRETFSPELDAWIKVSDGVGEFYPINWTSKDGCEPLSSWWGISSNDLSSFDPNSATHILISDVPNCTIGGVNPIVINTGKGGTFRVKDTKLDSGGYITGTIQFIKDYELDSTLSGTFDITTNTGFKLTIEAGNKIEHTAFQIPVNTDYYINTTTYEYGVSSIPFDPYYDEGAGNDRVIAGVFDVAPYGSNNFGNSLLSFDYVVTQQMFGYNGYGNRNFNQYGYDIVTYELSMQYLEMVRRRFGGGNEVSYDFNPDTQRLRLYKHQGQRFSNGCYMLGIYIEKSIEHMLTKTWVQDYATALVKITMGNTLTKFGGTTIGGLQINGNDVLTQGIEEKNQLLEQLRNTKTEAGADTPFYVY